MGPKGYAEGHREEEFVRCMLLKNIGRLRISCQGHVVLVGSKDFHVTKVDFQGRATPRASLGLRP